MKGCWMLFLGLGSWLLLSGCAADDEAAGAGEQGGVVGASCTHCHLGDRVGALSLGQECSTTLAMTYESHVAQMEFFEGSGQRMAYLDVGPKDAQRVLVLVHGIPTNSWMYRLLIPRLVKQGVRVVVPDLMGFGQSARPDEWEHYRFENQAALLLDLLDFLQVEEFELMVHDMGGMVGWELIRQRPRAIERMFCLNTIIYDEQFRAPVSVPFEWGLVRMLLGVYRTPIGRLMVGTFLRGGVRNGYEWPEGGKEGYMEPLSRGTKGITYFFTHVKEIRARLKEDRARLAEADVEVQLIWGPEDPFLKVEAATRLQQELGLSADAVHVLEGRNHLLAEDSAVEIAEIVLAVD